MNELYIIACLLILPVAIFSMYASSKVNSTFRKYSKISASANLSASQIVAQILNHAGLTEVRVARTPGSLTDHFDPRDNTVYLSESVFDSNSVASIGVAAHEVGHAIQFAKGYFPLKIRTALVPVVNLGSKLSLPLLLIAMLVSGMSMLAPSIANILIYAAIAVFSLTTIFTFVTLPVEFNASKRAQQILGELSILEKEELTSSKAVLNAAAMTYVAAFAMSLVQLIRIIGLLSNRKR